MIAVEGFTEDVTMSVCGKERIAHYLPDLCITLVRAVDYDYIHVTGDL